MGEHSHPHQTQQLAILKVKLKLPALVQDKSKLFILLRTSLHHRTPPEAEAASGKNQSKTELCAVNDMVPGATIYFLPQVFQDPGLRRSEQSQLLSQQGGRTQPQEGQSAF